MSELLFLQKHRLPLGYLGSHYCRETLQETPNTLLLRLPSISGENFPEFDGTIWVEAKPDHLYISVTLPTSHPLTPSNLINILYRLLSAAGFSCPDLSFKAVSPYELSADGKCYRL